MHILKVFTEKRITGNVGEDAACRYLRRRFYKIVERNLVEGGHEIDIVAENRKYLCFVEVKTRTASKIGSKESRPALSVTPEKQRSIISAANIYTRFRNTHKKIRFDVAEVYLDDEKKVIKINYMESAFTANTSFAR